MCLIYGLAEEYVRAAKRLYQERYPESDTPGYQSFTILHRNLYKNGSLRDNRHRAGHKTATAGSDVVQSGRPIFDDFFQHSWPYIGNNTVNVVFQMVKRFWLIRIEQ
ncbi:hypothetical protein TNCV_1621661 [Trichonephila clavipes]|nr:hypothetical protein TNCV_1621661 [Trichonephila clavipes]